MPGNIEISKEKRHEEVAASSGFDTLSNLPRFESHMELLGKERVPQHDLELQRIYDDARLGEDETGWWTLVDRLSEYNMTSEVPYLASGQSGYFNEQIDSNGFNKQLRLRQQDVDDAKYIANFFGEALEYGENDLPMLYMALPGTAELEYAMQTFPAGIYEDVFQNDPTHALPIRPIVGEPEQVYWRRVLEDRIASATPDEKAEIMERGGRLIDNFCKNKNRIYFIPFQNLAQNKASFGDMSGLRDGSMSVNQVQQKLDEVPSFEGLLQQEYVNSTWDAYNNPNFTSEYGIAIYGDIDSANTKYIEVDRKYDIMQKRALVAGMKPGELIPEEISG